MIGCQRRIRFKREFPRRLDAVQTRQLKNLKAPREVIEEAKRMEFNVIDASTGKTLRLS